MAWTIARNHIVKDFFCESKSRERETEREGLQSPPSLCTPILTKVPSSKNLKVSLIGMHISFPLPQSPAVPGLKESMKGQLKAASTLGLEWCGLSPGGWGAGQGCSPSSAWTGAIWWTAWVPGLHQPDHQLQVLLFQKDPVCYMKKAFPLVQDIMEDTLRFKDNTSNANAVVKLQELSVSLKDCFPKDTEGFDKVGGSWSREH